MKKSEIINEVSVRMHMKKIEIQRIVEEIIDVIKNAVIAGEEVQIRRFGRFFMKKRKAKVGRNISKNVAINIPETCIPSFRPSKEFSDRVKDSIEVSPGTL